MTAPPRPLGIHDFDEVDGLEVLWTRRLAPHVAPVLADLGLRPMPRGHRLAPILVATDTDPAGEIPAEQFATDLRLFLTRWLAAANGSPRLTRVCLTTIELLHRNDRYFRQTVHDVLERIEHDHGLDYPAIDAVRAANRAQRARDRNAAAGRRPQTPAERKAAQRARDRAAAESSARWFIAELLASEDRPERITGAELYEMACESLSALVSEFEDEGPEYWPSYAESEGYPPRPVVPPRRVFYAVADELLAETRPGNVRTYAPPPEEPRMSTTTDTIIERAARLLAEEARSEIEAQRGRVSTATGTDGAVIDLAERRGRRT